MLTKLIIHHPRRATILKKYVELKLATKFNTCMYLLYRQLYYKHRRGWNIIRTAYILFWMTRYQRRMMKAQIAELMFQLNKDSDVTTTRTL